MVFAGNNGHDFAAYDLAAGKRLWSKIPGHQDRQFGSMARVGDVVYFAGSMAGSVNAHDAASGNRLWMTHVWPDQVLINSGGEPGYEILGSPAVAHGRVYVGCNDGKLHTFSADKGERGWAFAAGGPIQSSPTVAGRVVYFGSHDAHLYAVDAETGKELGRFKTGGRIISTPWPADGVVYVGCDDGHVYAVE
jgi:outer membrane protein assembly factor BamB